MTRDEVKIGKIVKYHGGNKKYMLVHDFNDGEVVIIETITTKRYIAKIRQLDEIKLNPTMKHLPNGDTVITVPNTCNSWRFLCDEVIINE